MCCVCVVLFFVSNDYGKIANVVGDVDSRKRACQCELSSVAVHVSVVWRSPCILQELVTDGNTVIPH